MENYTKKVKHSPKAGQNNINTINSVALVDVNLLTRGDVLVVHEYAHVKPPYYMGGLAEWTSSCV